MIKELLTSLKMAGAIEALDHLDLKDKNQFLTALLQAEIDYRQQRSNKRRLGATKKCPQESISCFVIDEGRPLGIALQEEVPNRLETNDLQGDQREAIEEKVVKTIR